MGNNVWRFLRLEDGTYAVYHRGNRLAEGIAAEWREQEFCERWVSVATNARKSSASSMSSVNVRLCSELSGSVLRKPNWTERLCVYTLDRLS